MWNGSIRFPVKKESQTDAAGFSEDSYEYTEQVPANVTDATRSEAVLAQQTGYQADIMVEIMACNDNGAPFFVNESDGRAYDVRRRFHKDKGMLVQLTGERRVRDAF